MSLKLTQALDVVVELQVEKDKRMKTGQKKAKLAILILLVILAFPAPIRGAARNDGLGDRQTSLYSNLELAGHWGGLAGRVVVAGERAYLAQGPELSIIDISDPAHLRRAGFVMFPGKVTGLELKDNRLYAGWGLCDMGYNCTGAVKIFEISLNGALIELAEIQLPGQAGDIDIAGTIAYLLWNSRNVNYPYGGLIAYDFTDPVHPVKGGSLETVPGPLNFGLAGDYGYLVDDDRFYFVIDLSDPLTPVLIDTPFYFWGRDLQVSGDYAYLSDFSVLSLADPLHPVRIARLGFDGTGSGIVLSGQHAYVSVSGSCQSDDGGLRVFDIANPSAPVNVAFLSAPCGSEGVAVQGHYAYLAETYQGLAAVDISDPTKPSVVGKYIASGETYNVRYSENRLYTINHWYRPGASGLWIADANDPALPIGRGFFQDFAVMRLAVEKNIAYPLTGGFQGDDINLQIVDVSDPAHPAGRGSYPFPREYAAWAIAAQGGFVYVAQTNRCVILDARDPDNPVEIAAIPANQAVVGVDVSGAYLYVSDAGVRVFDVHDPAHPVEAGAYQAGAGTSYLTVFGNYAYVRGGGGQMHIVDVSNPASPQEISTVAIPSDILDLASEGGYVFLASDYDGLHIIDATDPLRPFETATYRFPGTIAGVNVSMGYVFVGAKDDGAYIFRFDPLFKHVFLPLVSRECAKRIKEPSPRRPPRNTCYYPEER